MGLEVTGLLEGDAVGSDEVGLEVTGLLDGEVVGLIVSGLFDGDNDNVWSAVIGLSVTGLLLGTGVNSGFVGVSVWGEADGVSDGYCVDDAAGINMCL